MITITTITNIPSFTGCTAAATTAHENGPDSVKSRAVVNRFSSRVAISQTLWNMRLVASSLMLVRLKGATRSSATISLRGGTRMGNVSSIIGQLKKERDRVEKQLSGLNAALTAFAGAYSNGEPSRKRRKMSAKSRAKIAAAQRRRWAKFRKSKT
jgi:hypothetical protein